MHASTPLDRGLVLAAAALTLAACSTDDPTAPSSTSPRLAVSAAVAQTGNGAPSGAHYNLNIIGMSHDKSANMTGGDGHRIFVDLGAKGTAAGTKINLTEGPFAVLD